MSVEAPVAARPDADVRPPAAVTDDALAFRVPVAITARMARAFLVIWVLLAAGHGTALLLEHVLGVSGAEGLVDYLSLSSESSPGTWMSGLLHALCALLATGGALLARAGSSRWQRSWWLLAATFAFLSLDEVSALHDRMTSELSDAVGGTSGVLTYVWVVPALALGLVFLVVQLPFLRHLGATGRRLVLAGAVFVAGAAGFEMVEGVLDTADGEDTATYDLLVMGEELTEIAGVMWAAGILTGHLVRTLQEPLVAIHPGAGQPPAPGTQGAGRFSR